MIKSLKESLKVAPPNCYHCGKTEEESDKSHMQLRSHSYSQTFCLECYGLMLEYVSQCMKKGGIAVDHKRTSEGLR